jgi:GNAT superfamily N-acetyltransferase
MEKHFREMKPSDLKEIYKRIRRDFKPGEYAPSFVLRRQLKTGVQSGLIMKSDGRDSAYVICSDKNANGYVLISLLAVFEEYRGQGLGKALLEELTDRYSEGNGLIVEVEKPELAENDAEKAASVSRIRFYENKGYRLIPGIDYSIWDVPMHLMVLPQKAQLQYITGNIGQIMYDIYLKLMGKPFINKMKIKFGSAEPG